MFHREEGIGASRITEGYDGVNFIYYKSTAIPMNNVSCHKNIRQ